MTSSQHAAAPPLDPHDHVFHFLLVEDDEAHAELIRRNLQRQPVSTRLTRVDNGADALSLLMQEPPFEDADLPDMVLLDLKLPKVNGLTVLETIKQDRDLAHLPVVVLTTSDAQADRKRANLSHANSYLVKPLDFGAFRDLIRDICQYWGVHNATRKR